MDSVGHTLKGSYFMHIKFLPKEPGKILDTKLNFPWSILETSNGFFPLNFSIFSSLGNSTIQSDI